LTEDVCVEEKEEMLIEHVLEHKGVVEDEVVYGELP